MNGPNSEITAHLSLGDTNNISSFNWEFYTNCNSDALVGSFQYFFFNLVKHIYRKLNVCEEEFMMYFIILFS